jgi:hypothetical protein
LFLLEGRSQVEVRNCDFRDNVAGRRDRGRGIEFTDCQFTGNQFGGAATP